MNSKRKLSMITIFSAIAVAFSAFVALGGGSRIIRSLKGDASHITTITADDVKNAIGAGTVGNFTVDGLEWHVDSASYDDGKATINGGTLYNVTMAGQSVNPLNNMKGNGFFKMVIHDKASATGINFETKDKNDTLITRRGLGAETQAVYEVDFSADNATKKVARVFLAFGAGGGTSFTSIDFYYNCAEAVPSLTLSVPTDTITVAGTVQIATAFDNVSGNPTVTYVSSDTDVVTVGEHTGLVTGVAAGTATITASFVYDEVVYSASNSIEITVASSTESIVWYRDNDGNTSTNNRNHIEGAGVWAFLNYKVMGYTGPADLLAAKANIEVSFTGTSSRIDTCSDDIANTYCRVYVVLGAALENGKLSLTIPSKDGSSIYTGNVTFTASEATAYNS